MNSSTRQLPMFPIINKPHEITQHASTGISARLSFRAGDRVSVPSSLPETRDLAAEHSDENPVRSQYIKSRSIPISNGMKRTPSELQLCQDQEVAEFRDYVMFSRIVNRMAKQQREVKDFKVRRQNDLCLARIIRTRNGEPSEGENESSLRDAQTRLHMLTAPYSYFPDRNAMNAIDDIVLNSDEDDDSCDDDDGALFELDL